MRSAGVLYNEGVNVFGIVISLAQLLVSTAFGVCPLVELACLTMLEHLDMMNPVQCLALRDDIIHCMEMNRESAFRESCRVTMLLRHNMRPGLVCFGRRRSPAWLITIVNGME